MLGRQCTASCHAFDLNDHHSAASARRLCLGQHIQETRFFLHGYIAVFVGRRASQEADIEMHSLEEEIIFAAELHEFDEVLFSTFALAAAAMTRVDKGVQSRPGE